MARNLYSVSPGEPTEKVVFIDDEISDPFALVVAESEGRAYEIGAPLFMFD